MLIGGDGKEVRLVGTCSGLRLLPLSSTPPMRPSTFPPKHWQLWLGSQIDVGEGLIWV